MSIPGVRRNGGHVEPKRINGRDAQPAAGIARPVAKDKIAEFIRTRF